LGRFASTVGAGGKVVGDLADQLLEPSGILIKELLQVTQELAGGGNRGRNSITTLIIFFVPRRVSGRQTSCR
jgi:hypothetical protein